nr:hypothetical protein [uncultured Rhizobium sp.]
MLLDLGQIADGDMVAYRASNLLCSLQNILRRNCERLSGHHRDQLLVAFAKARRQILDLFTSQPEFDHVVACYDAIAGLIIWGAEGSLDRAKRPAHFHTDLHAYVRWLRNACHNIALLEQVQERAYNRRARAIAELHERAVA